MATIRSKHIDKYKDAVRDFPSLYKATNIMPPPPADIIGRDINELRRGLRNPEKANVVLLAEPGTGKTAYVQGFAYDKETLQYYLTLEVNPEKLINPDGDRDNALLTGFNQLLDEARDYSKKYNVIVVLFIDEFHKMAEISPSLMESLKPRLEKSAMHGFRLIAATTFQEYNENIAPNRALDQRFLQIKLPELSKQAVLKVLMNRAQQNGVDKLLDDHILEDIYDESKSILISNAQPRASIDILNSMIGDTIKKEYMKDGKLKKEFFTAKELGFPTENVICRPLLKKIIRRTHGIDIDNEVDVTEVIHALKTRLYNQDNAITIAARNLEMAACGFSELDRPKFSFLSTGTTGVGKRLDDDTMIPVYTADHSKFYKRNGDLAIGDYVFNRKGQPVKVVDVFHYQHCEMLEVELTDGRTILADPEHLWAYKSCSGNGANKWKVADTQTLMAKYQNKYYHKGRSAHQIKFVIPMNKAVQWDELPYKTDPYVIGVALGNGCLTDSAFSISSQDEECIAKVSALIGADSYKKAKSNYTWTFNLGEANKQPRRKVYQTSDVLSDVPELINTYANQKHIPDMYKHGSITQRWDLIRGLFDTDGTISNNSRFNVSYSTSSKTLAYDIQEVLYSLGVSSSIACHHREGKSDEYDLHVKIENKDKKQFFYLTRKRDIAMKAAEFDSQKTRIKKFGDVIGIRDIRKTGVYKDATCIMVDDEEHLYQAGQFIVTHNTELAKIVSETMRIPLKRFDMSRYSNPADAGRFADDLFNAVWATPNAYLLLDEVEKSSAEAMNILLQVLDDARLTDSVNPDRVASFSGTIINLTTNLGSEVYQNMAKHQSANAEADLALVYKSLAESNNSKFNSAVLGRIDTIVPFHPLPEEALEKIARRTLNDVIEVAQTDERRIIVSDDIIPYIVKDRTSSDTEQGGARDVKRNVKNIVVQALAHYLTYAEKEVPIVIYLRGKPRFKFREIVDPLNATVDIAECHSTETVNNMLNQLSIRLGKPLLNDGLYLPTLKNINEYGSEIAHLAVQGAFGFRSRIDGEDVIIESR